MSTTMLTCLEIAFWLMAGAVLYSYVGYPLLLWLRASVRGKDNRLQLRKDWPAVTYVVAAHNEEQYIRKKIENALALDYEPERFRVVVVSDGSTDRTDEIARSFDDDRFSFLRVDDRGGKAQALNRALETIDSEIVVFTDANVFADKDAVRRLVECLFADDVGAATARVELVASTDSEPLGEGVYMRYERWIQKLESSFWSVVGVDGALFAVRRKYLSPLPRNTILDDFRTALEVAMAGQRIVYEPAARAVEEVPAEVSQEFRRKSRIAAGGFQLLRDVGYRKLHSAPGRFLFSFVSHKLIRWYVPFLLIGALIASALLSGSLVYRGLFFAQVVLYGIALVALFFPRVRRLSIPYVAYYFVSLNAALLVGWFRAKRGTQRVTWRRVDR